MIKFKHKSIYRIDIHSTQWIEQRVCVLFESQNTFSHKAHENY